MINQVHKVGKKWAIGEGEPIYLTEEEAQTAYNRWLNNKPKSTGEQQ